MLTSLTLIPGCTYDNEGMFIPSLRYPILQECLLLQSCFERAIAYRSAGRKFLGGMKNTSQCWGDAYPWGNRFERDLPPCPKGVRLGFANRFLGVVKIFTQNSYS